MDAPMKRCILCVIEHIKLRRLDRDPTLLMRFQALNLSRYNSCLNARVLSDDPWTRAHVIDARCLPRSHPTFVMPPRRLKQENKRGT